MVGEGDWVGFALGGKVEKLDDQYLDDKCST